MEAPCDFHKQLSDSDMHADIVYSSVKAREPSLLGIHKSHKANDLKGADYILEFPNCIYENLDLKSRKKDFGDDGIVVEYDVGGRTGWSLDTKKLTNWLLFYWIDTGKTELIPFRQYQNAVIKNFDKWVNTYKTYEQLSFDSKTGKKWIAKCFFIESVTLWRAIHEIYGKH